MSDTDIVSVLLARAASGDKESAEAAAEIVRLREMMERRETQRKRLAVASVQDATHWKALSKVKAYTHGLPFHEKVKARAIVDEATGCWVWQGACGINGYGVLRRGPTGKPAYCHRIMYEHANGSVPEGAVVMHTCDNRRCVNPDHLAAGTQGDNIRDMHRKGRSPRSVLTAAEVQEIRTLKQDGMTFHAIAKRFMVSPQTVSNIVTGKAWKWLA